MSNETELPKYIIARRTFTYNVEEIIQIVRELKDDPDYSVEEEDIWAVLDEWVYDDMRSPMSRHDLSYVDENGNEL